MTKRRLLLVAVFASIACNPRERALDVGDALAADDAGTSDAGGPRVDAGGATFPVYADGFADPFVLREGATYHAYATNGKHRHIQHMQSTDRRAWTDPDEALPNLGAWAEAANFTWAPSVLAVGDGTFVLYYAAKKAGSSPLGQRGHQCIGRAVGTQPQGPFVDELGEPFICPAKGAWAIDPSPFRAADGKVYLLWREDAPPTPQVVIRELAPSGTSFADGSSASVLVQRDRDWEETIVENPSMRAIDGQIVLFYSANAWATADYAVGYATCDAPTGPCTKVTTDGPWFASTATLAGPGGQDFFTDTDGALWMSFHAWIPPKIGPDQGGVRALGMMPIVSSEWKYRPPAP